MFLREPYISVDLLFPNHLEYTRPIGKETTTVPLAEVDLSDVAPDLNKSEVDVFEDFTLSDIENKLPVEIREYIREKRERLKSCFQIVESNKSNKMQRAKKDFDRKIRKTEYKLGDWVLVHHPN
jgi:hypothetical protein